jgi:hypothetical protein
MRAGNGRKPETLYGQECIYGTRKYCTAEEASLTIALPKRQGIAQNPRNIAGLRQLAAIS